MRWKLWYWNLTSRLFPSSFVTKFEGGLSKSDCLWKRKVVVHGMEEDHAGWRMDRWREDDIIRRHEISMKSRGRTFVEYVEHNKGRSQIHHGQEKKKRVRLESKLRKKRHRRNRLTVITGYEVHLLCSASNVSSMLLKPSSVGHLVELSERRSSVFGSRDPTSVFGCDSL